MQADGPLAPRLHAPRSNLVRNMILWEIASYVTGTAGYDAKAIGRDVCIQVGNGSGSAFESKLAFANGQPALAHAVVAGQLDGSWMNPSALLTQAYRGTGVFPDPLPVRAVAVYPSWDRALFVVRPDTGITSLHQVRERKYPLRIWVRGDAAHATRILLDQLLEKYGFTLDDVRAWGGAVEPATNPRDTKRAEAIRRGEADMVFDEGIIQWLDDALKSGMQPLAIESDVLDHLVSIGWRRAVVKGGQFQHLQADHECVDFGGWPLYVRASLSDAAVRETCDALVSAESNIFWEESFQGIDQLWRDTEATPCDVPFHPAAERWFAERFGR